jgi:phospholipase C
VKALVKTIEKNYGRAARGIMATVNPVKKIIIKTYCDVHKYINIRAIEIINQQGCEEKSDFFMKHINELNSGVMWAFIT